MREHGQGKGGKSRIGEGDKGGEGGERGEADADRGMVQEVTLRQNQSNSQ